MLALPIVGFLIIGTGNFLASRLGFSNFKTGDKDILFPFSSAILLFFSLLIYLPQVNGKINKLQTQQPSLDKQLQMETEQEQFPVSFLLSLLSLSLAVFIDKFFINKSDNLKNQDERNLHNPTSTSSNQNFNNQNKQNATALKYFLSLAILFINIYNAYFVTLERKESSLLPQLLLFFAFSLVLNFSFGFLLAWSQIQQSLLNNLLAFTNFGLVIGVMIALFMEVSSQVAILHCFSIGFALYTAVFICLPKIFTNGQKPIQDRFRYWAVCTALLLTLIYYPCLYLLKI